jgi:hypothetical protein
MFSFVFWLANLWLCARLGSQRIMGRYAGLLYGLIFSIFGILFILSSRRLDDEQANAALMKKYSPKSQ